MQALGLSDDLAAVASGHVKDGSHTMHIRKSDEKEDIPFAHMEQSGGTSFHRSHLLGCLRKHIPDSCHIYFDKRLESYTKLPTGDFRLAFKDGTQATHDLVVGCDGVRSTVRALLYRSLAEQAERAGEQPKASEYASKADPVWSGNIAYRGLAPRAVLEEAVPNHPAFAGGVFLLGKDKHIILYPIAQGKFVNVVALVSRQKLEGTQYAASWIREAGKEDVLSEYHGWEPMVTATLKAMERTDLWAINVVPNLPTYVGDGIALVGDAAHAMTTHLGAGAGQAVEDAFVLASLLVHPTATAKTLAYALRAYDEVRRPLTQWVVERSRECGLTEEFNMLPSTGDEGVRDPERDLQQVVERMKELFSWAKETSAIADRDKAMAMFEAALVS
ncbi:uncharacterized protein B0H18DRAFT_997735 [Fomitopsis serialis]|uniref:uncharacterized protein n=1 Tax=Fomitopsis serialis TaxID=139415 RepID=UPI0020088F43|nr:uncharacterized protein B0H18DRAFT_997735 [Neoantrodia serialis]KAH9929144.1 hypothetical protein B0H18DRAFT_997735 [Neoantrodia serialis]